MSKAKGVYLVLALLLAEVTGGTENGIVRGDARVCIPVCGKPPLFVVGFSPDTWSPNHLPKSPAINTVGLSSHPLSTSQWGHFYTIALTENATAFTQEKEFLIFILYVLAYVYFLCVL